MMNSNFNKISKIQGLGFLLAFFIGPLSSVFALQADLGGGNQLQLFGIGAHQELRNDIYIGALLVPAGVTEISQIKDKNVAKRMSFRFMHKYSPRQLNRMFKQRMAMNNPRSQWQPLTKEIKQFSSIFKRSMESGDEINIDYLPSNGVTVYLNQTRFVNIPSSDFMNLLLNIWLGNVPPTKAFKAGITGQISESQKSDFEAQYLALTPIVGRFDADLQPVAKVAKAEQPVKKTTNTKNTTSKSNSASKENPKKQPTKKTVAKKPTPKKSDNNKSTTKTVKKTAKKTASKDNSLAVKKPQPATASVPVVTTNKKQNSQDQSKKSSAEIADSKSKAIQVAKIEKPKPQIPVPEEKDDSFDADLLAGSYSRELINAVRAKQFYPRKAQIKGEEGSVTALVKIDKNGEILSTELIDRSGSRELDRAVQKMIRRASPYPAIPVELKQDSYEFEVPITFNMAKD